MENTENKYQRGKIYKLSSNQTNLVYYGSTIENTLTNRISGHRKNYKYWGIGKKNYISSYEIVKYDDCKIVLVEAFPCKSIYELLAREQYYIDKNECVNKCKAYTGLNAKAYKKQYYEENVDKIREQHKLHYQENFAKINEHNKQYHLSHINETKEYQKLYYRKHEDELKEKSKTYFREHYDEIKEKKKDYYICHIEEIKEYKKHYQKLHADAIKEQKIQSRLNNSEIITCSCGSQIKKYKLNAHQKTQKHQTWISSQIPQ